MTCDNIDSDANVFAQNCIIFVHCAMFCLQFISVCMYAYEHVRFSYVYSTRIQRVHAAVHSYSCIFLLRGAACSLHCRRDGVYFVVHAQSSLPSSTVMYLYMFSKCSTNISRKNRNSTRFLTDQQ